MVSAETTRNEGAASTKTSKRKYNAAPEWKICGIASKRFDRLPNEIQNTDNKRIIINTVLSENVSICPDAGDWWSWLEDQASLLLRTWDFKDTCQKYNLDSQAVAEHLVLYGKKANIEIRLNGLATLGNVIRQYGERLFKDPHGLYSSNGKTEDDD